MAVVFPLTFPTYPEPAEATVEPNDSVAALASIFTGQEDIQEHQGGFWTLSVTWDLMHWEEAAPFVAVLTKLRGMGGTFLFGDPITAQPLGNAVGAPVVDGFGQTGLELLTRGWNPGAPDVLKAGDNIQIGTGAQTRLHKVVADASADAGGLVTLDIWPRLRESPADGTAIVTQNPLGTFRLASNARAWREVAPKLVSIQFEAREAF